MFKSLVLLASALLVGLVVAEEEIDRSEVLKCAASVRPHIEKLEIPSEVEAILNKIRLDQPGKPFSLMGMPDAAFRAKYIGDLLPNSCAAMMAEITINKLRVHCLADLLENHPEQDQQVFEIFWTSSELHDRLMGAVSVCTYVLEVA